MIGGLRGIVGEVERDRVLIWCAGVAYQVRCSGMLLASLRARRDQPCTLSVITIVRETELSLIGFEEADERSMFELLCLVKNLGPGKALSALSGATADEIAKAIHGHDVKQLASMCRGIGNTLAEAIVKDLADHHGIARLAGLA